MSYGDGSAAKPQKTAETRRRVLASYGYTAENNSYQARKILYSNTGIELENAGE